MFNQPQTSIKLEKLRLITHHIMEKNKQQTKVKQKIHTIIGQDVL